MTELSCIHAFERDLSPASALATALGVPVRTVALHRFPDGESLVRSTTEDARPVLYCRLDHPNERLIEALLAADALGGKPVLVAGMVTSIGAPALSWLRTEAVRSLSPLAKTTTSILSELRTREKPPALALSATAF